MNGLLDPRGGLAGELAQRAAPAPGDGQGRPPSRAAFASAASSIDRARRDWSRAVQAVGVIGRERRLSSRDRRAASDLAWHVIRGRRLLGVLLGAPDDSASSLDLVRAAAVLWEGAPRDLLAAELRDGLDDPRHALLGWVMQTSPSPAAALGTATSLPDWFASELLASHSTEDAVAIAKSLLGRAPLTLRVHRDRATRAAVLEELAAAKVRAVPSELAPDAIELIGRVNVRSLGPVQRGEASVQDAGSQLIAALVNPQAGERILDACAGAGGKSLALGSLAPGARVMGTDVRRAALEKAAGRAREAGLSDRLRFVPIPERGGLPDAVAAFAADAVLIDAPCTGSGSLRREPHARWSRSPLEIERLPALQGEILDRFAPLVKPGGRLVYATCSFFPRENEEVIDAFLGRNPAFRLSEEAPLRLRPDLHGCDGFFASLLLRSP